MALNQFIPTIWSARLLHNLDKAGVYVALCNRDYEGEITGAGDTVKINSIGRVTIGNYTKNTDIADPETLTDAQTSLTIDQQKYFNFQVDDIDKAQQTPKVMDEAMKEAAYGLSDVADLSVAGLYTGVDAGNVIGSDGAPTVINTPTLAYDTLVDLGVKLDDARIPSEGRWVVLPTWYSALFQKDTARFIGAGSLTDQQLRDKGFPAQGYIGEIAGFQAYKSLNVPHTGGIRYKIIAGYRGAISFAEQIVKVEAYSPEKRFADAVKGLHVYGRKLVRPTGIAVLTANKA